MLHANEVAIDLDLVRHLVDARFPAWRELPLRAVATAGTDHAIFRLGTELSVRLPRHPGAARQAVREWRWLPLLAPGLPLPVPAPLAMGEPAAHFPFGWTVTPWFAGQDGHRRQPALTPAAEALAGFVAALRAAPSCAGAEPGPANSGRGAPLAERDAAVRRALAEAADLVDARACLSLWRRCLAAPAAVRAAWLHGDIHAGNLIVRNRRIAAVIDFGCMGVGDPACDLQPAWTLLDRAARLRFRAALGCDDAEWLRGQGWALSVALIQLPYYRTSNPTIVAMALRAVRELLAEG